MKIAKIADILNKLDNCIINKEPFSLIRFGDGGIKLMHSVLFDDVPQYQAICEHEGLPENKLVEILALWGMYANKADYIDTPEVYFTDKFWGRYKIYKDGYVKNITEKTRKRLLMWKELYSGIGIKVNSVNYCNPEANWLSLLKNPPHKNLLEILKNRKICCISTYSNVPSLSKKYNIEYWKIVGHDQGHYYNSFNQTIDFINENVNKYDLWLNSSGELGRVYSGVIKDLGGRVFDLGFVIDYFVNWHIVRRLEYYLKQDPDNKMQLILTNIGENYRKYI